MNTHALRIPHPVRTGFGGLGRRTTIILAAAVVAALVVAAIALFTGGGSGSAGTVTADEFGQVQLDMSKANVSSLLGDPESTGPFTAQLGGYEPTEFSDCWFYNPGDAVVCFEGDSVSMVQTPSELFGASSSAP